MADRRAAVRAQAVNPVPVGEVLDDLRARADPVAAEGMLRFGIRPARPPLGIGMVTLRRMARRLGKDHQLAHDLWASGIHEARLLATIVDDPAEVTAAQMEQWALDFDTWDICDQCCHNLFGRTAMALDKAVEWSARSEEFVRRSGFVLMASTAAHRKQEPDRTFLAFLPLLGEGAKDDRNFVKKAVSWSLRQIGKRNRSLNDAVLDAVEPLRAAPEGSVRWVANDVRRELTSDAVQRRLAAPV